MDRIPVWIEFKFDIKYMKEKENNAEDALSMKFHIASIIICKEDLRTRVLEVASNNEFYL